MPLWAPPSMLYNSTICCRAEQFDRALISLHIDYAMKQDAKGRLNAQLYSINKNK